MAACHHEAGHALARWYFGYSIDCVRVQIVAECLSGRAVADQRGRLWQAEGIVEGFDIALFGDPSLYSGMENESEILSNGRVRARIALVELMAGPVAETVYTKRSGAGRLLEGGGGDIMQAYDIIARWLCNESGDQIEEAWRKATALIRSKLGSRGCTAVAQQLHSTGFIDDTGLNALLIDIFVVRDVFPSR